MKSMMKVSAIALSMSLAACATVDPYTGEQKMSSAAKGALIGALGCALVGAGESRKHARNAALGCATVGAGIGFYMDQQEAKLRQRLAQTGVGVKREGNDIRLIMPGNITFPSSQFIILTHFQPVLNDVALVLNEFDKTQVLIQGYTDSTGSLQLNQTLSQQRAQSVANYLMSQQVSANRIVSQGFGPQNPIANNSTAAGRQQNRRVEILLRPTQQ